MTTPPLHNTDEQSMICTECNYRCETPSEYHPYWYCILAKAGQLDIAKSAILSLLAEARTTERQSFESIAFDACDAANLSGLDKRDVMQFVTEALRQKESKDERDQI